MMKKSIGVLILCVLFFGVSGQRVTGKVGALKTERVYLYEVVNEYREIYRKIDSAEVKNGQFVFACKEMTPELYFVGDTPEHGGYFFLDGEKIELTPERVTDEGVVWNVTGSALDKMYREFVKQLYVVTNGQVRDSLDECFMEARAQQNEVEMARIKKESMPYYEQGREKERVLVNKFIGENKNNPFGMYLYYCKMFQFKDFPDMKNILAEKTYIGNFGKMARDTRYISLMADRLDMYENCAIGHEAPEIVGKDTLGNMMRLSDLRGSYVLVDFWNSYCHWCREETPALRNALEHFKGMNFKVLGVSSDSFQDKWMEAIHKDGSYWNHLMLERGDKVMDRYCIKGIPHIILVGPDGKILAKDMRGEELITVSAMFVK